MTKTEIEKLVARIVKPLEWSRLAAKTEFGTYWIHSDTETEWTCVFEQLPGASNAHEVIKFECKSVEEAKAAAQADYEKRILSCLDLTALEAAQARVAELEKALAVHEPIGWRIWRKLQRDFPIGLRVQMAEELLRSFPQYRGKQGTVVGYYKKVSPKVQWDGQKTASSYAKEFILPARTARDGEGQ